MIERPQTKGEELANCITHGLFLIAVFIFTPLIIAKSLKTENSMVILTTAIFVASVILVYLISTVYHAMPRNRAKDTLRIVDHGAIYILIAGTYTPFALNVIKGNWGWTLFSIEWGLAFIGITLLYYTGLKYKKLSLLFYITMGWLVLIAIKPLWLSLPIWGIFWVFAGGLAYTFGTLYYRVSHLNFRHLIWHLFVVAGTTCHSIAVYLYAI
ncbi:MAG: PAQR family membrane homeostasis protein TrhA [Thermodesulfobacteriota bacterium]